MPRFSHAITLPMLLGLAACQSMGRPDAGMADARSRSTVCAALLESKPAYAGIAYHMPIGGKQAAIGQRSDRAFPEAAQRSALRSWKAEFDLCRQPTIEAAAATVPDGIWLLRRNYLISDRVIDDLIRGRITWGEANRKRDAIAIASWHALWPESEEERREGAGSARRTAPALAALPRDAQPVQLTPKVGPVRSVPLIRRGDT